MWNRWNKQYERFSFKEIKKTFKKWNANIPWTKLDEKGYRVQLDFALDEDTMTASYDKIYKSIGMIHGKRVGKNINQQLKEFTDDKFEPLFLKNVTEYLAQKEVLNRIVTVKKTYLKRIQTLLKNRLAEGQTIQQASREIKKLVNQPNFNKAEALRIARTETTAAANFAATQSGEVSGFVMEKEWISFIDGRTRDDHISADGQRVPQNEAFSVGGEKLMYPGAPNGSAGNVINCRCAVAVLAKRDNDGNLIPVS
jgi:uncharacterized protein with gpF-like domain